MTLPDIMLLPELARIYGVLVDDLFKESPQGYDKWVDRLVAVYEDSERNDDFMAAVTEYERMEKEGSMNAWDYRGYSWVYGTMLEVAKRKIYEYNNKSMELSKDNDTEIYYRTKIGMLAFRCFELGEGQKCIEEQLQAVKDEPGNSDEMSCLVAAYYYAQQYEECYLVAKEAIAKFPEEPRLYRIAGHVCKDLKKYDEAFTYWEKDLEFQTTILESLYAMAFCREEFWEYNKAYEAWMRIVKILNEQGAEVEVKFSMRKAEECKAKMGKKA